MNKTKFMMTTLTVLLCVSISSCRNGDHAGTDTTSADTSAADITTENTTAADPEFERIREEVLSVLTPSAEGAAAVIDDLIYTNTSGVSRDGWINTIPSEPDMARLYEIPADGGAPVILCKKEGCDHRDIRCNAEPGTSPLGVIGDEELLYYMIEVSRDNSSGIDPNEELSLELGMSVKKSGALFEYNLKTGVRRCVAAGLPFADSCSIYYNGTIYIRTKCADIRAESKFGQENHYVVYAVDAVTGDYECLDIGQTVFTAGIYDGKLYCVSVSGVVYACSTDLSVHEEVMQIKIRDMVDPAVVSGDMLYYYSSEDSGLYAVSLSDLTPPEKLGIEPDRFMCYNGDIYYTELDFVNYGWYGDFKVSTICGGTLLRYDAETKKSEAVFRDCGGDVLSLDYIDNEKIRFYGCYYAGLGLGHEYLDLEAGCAFFEYRSDTGEVRLVNEIPRGQ